MSASVAGVVTEFDERVGLGVVTDETGNAYPFHCTQIVDGTRTVAVGTAVNFVVRSDRPKGPEAYEVANA